METMTLADGYDRRKNPERREYRRMTVAEAKALQSGAHVPFLARDGTARTVKINGAPKTWKTRPAHVCVPIKYGMYETAYAESYGDADTDWASPLLVAVESAVRT